jgi:hypothetical protein
MDSLLDKWFALFQKFSGQDDHTGCTIAHFRILNIQNNLVKPYQLTLFISCQLNHCHIPVTCCIIKKYNTARQSCGSGTLYPGSDHFLIPDPGSKHFFIPNPTRKVECKVTFFLLLMFSEGKGLVLVKNIRDPENIHPGSATLQHAAVLRRPATPPWDIGTATDTDLCSCRSELEK